MIVESSSIENGHALRAEVCIIGAGAAGITIALDLIGSGIDVLLLEAGGRGAEPAGQQLYEGTVADARLHSPPDRYRQRRFGGTTTIWGGRCMPFDAIDFEARDFVAHSGWPIGPEALQPFYPRANRLVEAGEFAYTAGTAFANTLRPMIEGFTSGHFSTDTLERFSCPTDFGARYGHKLEAAQNVRVLLHANVTALNLRPGGNALGSVTVRNLEGGQLKVEAEHFVLATGGLEVARHLLANRDVQPNGIGNSHDVVGRYYMCHIAGTIGALRVQRPLASVWHGYDISAEGIYCRRRIALREATQRAQQIGNFVARLHHPRITDPAHRNSMLSLLYLAKPIIPYEYRIRLLGAGRETFGNWLRHLRNAIEGPFDSFAFAWHMLRDRRLAERKFPSIIVKSKANLFSIDFHAEQQPNPQSRITLGTANDALGMPRIQVDWRYTGADVDTVTRAIALLAQAFEQSQVGTLQYDPSGIEEEMTRYGAYGGHHIGTARMGVDPRSSVVDANCRVHEVANLFVAGSAVFPTSSQANPTLTIVALALRLSGHLRAALDASRLARQIRTDDSSSTSIA